MTLRQAWVRICSLPADAPLVAALREAREEAKRREASDAIDDVLTRYRPKGGSDGW